MQYATLGSTGLQVSRFGMGCMRLPLQAQPDGSRDNTKIDQDLAIQMIHYAMDHGVNYFDTAYPYHGGQSEALVGKALAGGRREKVILADKWPIVFAHLYDRYEDFEPLLDEQLRRLQTDYIDIYLLHALNADTWKKAYNLGVLDFLDQMLDKGKIRHAAFSFHDSHSTFREIVDAYDKWAMCQLQFNLIDEEAQAGIRGIRYAAEKGIPTVVMEPLRGGLLANNTPAQVQAVLDQAPVRRPPVDWAFRWVCDHPEVAVVLSGVSTMEQLVEDVDLFEDMLPGSMSAAERKVTTQVQQSYRELVAVPCTGCRYCMPCPSGVKIADVFENWNNATLVGDLKGSQERYQRMLVERGGDASQCVECGQCESVCPQQIPIIEKLQEAHQVLAV